MPVTPEDLSIPRASLGDTANIEDAINPALERIAAIIAPQDQGPWSTIPTATAARKGSRYLATDRAREYVCTGSEWLAVDSPAPIVTTLPTISGGAYEGQRVRFQPVSGTPIYWRFERIGSNWIPDGEQVPLQVAIDGSSNAAGPTWRPLGSPSFGTILVPVSGMYTLRFGAGSINLDPVASPYSRSISIAPVLYEGPSWPQILGTQNLVSTFSSGQTYVGSGGASEGRASLSVGAKVVMGAGSRYSGTADMAPGDFWSVRAWWLTLSPFSIPVAS